MKKILLPTDFSDNAWSAIVYALKLYEEEECTFYFLHSTKMKISTMTIVSNKLLRVMNESAMKKLLDLKQMAEVSNANANHDFEIIISTEDLKNAIEYAIKKHHINLVIMGTKGATGAKELFFGSNTVTIIKKMRLCPVLVVPEAHDFMVPKQIAFPTDFNRFYSDIELNPLKNLAALFNSKIRIVHINKEDELNDIQEYNMVSLKNFLEDFDISFHWLPDYNKKAKEIKDFIDDLHIDILVMVNYKHSFLESLINEPVISKIGLHPIVPFLSIPD